MGSGLWVRTGWRSSDRSSGGTRGEYSRRDDDCHDMGVDEPPPQHSGRGKPLNHEKKRGLAGFQTRGKIAFPAGNRNFSGSPFSFFSLQNGQPSEGS